MSHGPENDSAKNRTESQFPPSCTLIVAVSLPMSGSLAILSMLFNTGPLG